MRKLSIGLISALLFITSCAPHSKEEEIIQPENEHVKQEVSIVPNYQLTDKSYKMILPFVPSEARGVIVRQMSNRLDIDEMEDGLRRHSVDVFDPDKYFFDEGQYLKEDVVIEWIDGLNPPKNENKTVDDFRKNPRYLSHVLEQNFLKKNDDNTTELVGVSIGLALKSVYHFEAEGKAYNEKISKEDMLKQGEELAQTVLERVRKIEAIQGVPVMIALYREEDQSSPVPGSFVAKTTVPANDMMIGDWVKTNEEYVLFPSDQAKKKYFEDYEIVKKFGKEISTYFPNYVGYIGEGFYQDEELKKLSIEIPIEFYGGSEVIGFTQYAYGIVKSMFPNRYDLEIKIISSEKMESVIYRKADEEDPTVHVFH